MIDTVVLGAGIAGLGAAYGARRAGRKAVVFEARESAGGLLDNFTVDGFLFDTGVHLSFATEPEVREIFDRTPYVEHNAESLNWDRGSWLRHPTQNNMHALPDDQKVALIAGLVEAPDGPVANYRDWLICQYGTPIAERWATAPTCSISDAPGITQRERARAPGRRRPFPRRRPRACGRSWRGRRRRARAGAE